MDSKHVFLLEPESWPDLVDYGSGFNSGTSDVIVIHKHPGPRAWSVLHDKAEGISVLELVKEGQGNTALPPAKFILLQPCTKHLLNDKMRIYRAESELTVLGKQREWIM